MPPPARKPSMSFLDSALLVRPELWLRMVLSASVLLVL